MPIADLTGSSEISGYWVCGELEGFVSGARRVVAAMNALQTRCATEIEALDDGGLGFKVALREAGRSPPARQTGSPRLLLGLVRCPRWPSRLLTARSPRSMPPIERVPGWEVEWVLPVRGLWAD